MVHCLFPYHLVVITFDFEAEHSITSLGNRWWVERRERSSPRGQATSPGGGVTYLTFLGRLGRGVSDCFARGDAQPSRGGISQHLSNRRKALSRGDGKIPCRTRLAFSGGGATERFRNALRCRVPAAGKRRNRRPFACRANSLPPPGMRKFASVLLNFNKFKRSTHFRAELTS